MVAVMIVVQVIPVAGVLDITGLREMMVWWRREGWPVRGRVSKAKDAAPCTVSRSVEHKSPQPLHFTGEETEIQLMNVKFGFKAWLVSKAQFFILCDPGKSWPF